MIATGNLNRPPQRPTISGWIRPSVSSRLWIWPGRTSPSPCPPSPGTLINSSIDRCDRYKLVEPWQSLYRERHAWDGHHLSFGR